MVIAPEHPVEPDLAIGFILMNRFTLISVAGLVESLRFAADESFSSRQIFCQWEWMTWDNQPVTASCGLRVTPTAALDLARHWDYIVLAGGLLEETRTPPAWMLDAVREIHRRRIPIITLCSGSFVVANAGLLDGKRCAIHFTTRDEFKTRFPLVTPVIDQTWIHDDGIITSPGGTAIGLAADLIRHHCGELRAQKGLKYLLEDESSRKKTTAKKREAGNDPVIYDNERVQQVIDFMHHHLDSPVSIEEVAAFAGITTRQMNKEFVRSTGDTAAVYWRKMRLEQARRMMADSSHSINTIAEACGFADASHLIAWFRKQYGETPADFRKRRRAVEKLLTDDRRPGEPGR